MTRQSSSKPRGDDGAAPPARARSPITRRNAIVGVAAVGAGIMLDSTDFLSSLGASTQGQRLERIRRSPNFRDGVFQNPVETTIMKPGKTWEAAKGWFSASNVRPRGPLPTVEPACDSFTAPSNRLFACWLGHSSVLLELDGHRLLFDPVWASRSSPSTLIGPKRFQPNPLPLEHMPTLSAVVISHDHYDHLDKRTIQFLASTQPELRFATPLGVGAHLEKWGVPPKNIVELDWSEDVVVGELRLVCLPARHFSGRRLFDRNTTQWASWAAIGCTHRVFFSGDTGHHPGFGQFSRSHGPFDLTMLEIGAFHENWGTIHLGPDNALRAHQELGGRHLLPIHWGAFDLALHPWDEPVNRLVAEAARVGASLLIPRPGERIDVERAPIATEWWRPSES